MLGLSWLHLENVNQTIGAIPGADQATKDQLRALFDQLSAELQKAPADKSDDAEAVAVMAKSVADAAAKEKPNKTMVQICVQG